MAASGEKSRGRRAGEKREPRALNEDQTQNDVVLRFMIFFFKETPPKRRRFGLLATKTMLFYVSSA